MTLRPRRFQSPPMPEMPYSVLAPCSHPRLLAGRDREIELLLERLASPVPLLCVYGVAGVGKSSLIHGGVLPRLAADGRAAVHIQPGRGSIAGQITEGLFETPPSTRPDEIGIWLDVARQVTRQPPVVVFDPIDDWLHGSRRSEVAAVLARLALRSPGSEDPPCRSLLVCRQENFGPLSRWLGDLSRDLEGEPGDLPHDLAGPDHFQALALQPLGTPPAQEIDRGSTSSRILAHFASYPLEIKDSEGRGIYPWKLAPEDAQRLGDAFAELRQRHPNAPLAPEIHIVMAHLITEAGAPEQGERRTLQWTGESGRLVERALEDHLFRVIESVADQCLDTSSPPRERRTRLLLFLREMVTEPEEPAADPRPMLGERSMDILAGLSAPGARLLTHDGSALSWTLSHSRLEELICRIVADPVSAARHDLDHGLIRLWRLVALESALHVSGVSRRVGLAPALEIRIEEQADLLLHSAERRAWWQECRRQLSTDSQARQRRLYGLFLAVCLIVLAAWFGGRHLAAQRAEEALIATGDPEAAFAAADRVLRRGKGADRVRAALGRRPAPLDPLEMGTGGLPPEQRPAAVLRFSEIALPLIEQAPNDLARLARLVWALEAFAPRSPETLAALERALSPLRSAHPPPCDAGPGWISIPAGSFLMGAAPESGRTGDDKADEYPRHRVSLSGFRLLGHEVTSEQIRRLFPALEGPAQHPAVNITWYQAVVYAAWLGGRLPTEAEWEYAARAGCPADYCDRSGRPTELDSVAWWLGNSALPPSDEPTVRAVGGRSANAWGLHDMYGNVFELTADWFGSYPGGARHDPPGPTSGMSGYRAIRGGSVWESPEWIAPSARGVIPPDLPSDRVGFRVVLPPPGAWTLASGIPGCR